MKKYLFILIGFWVFQNLSAQFVLNLGKNVYYKANVEMEDGTTKNGYILSFDDKRAYYLDVSQYELLFASPEHNNGFTKDYYYFRENEKGDDEKLKFEEIKRMTVEEVQLSSNKVESIVYEKVKIAKPTNDLKMDFWENEVLLPIFYSNGKMKIYSYKQLQCQGKSISSCNVAGYNYYFKPNDAEYAVKPFEITAATIFSLKKIGPKIYTAFEYMGKDCTLYLEHLTARKSKYGESFSSSANKEYSEIFKKEQDAYKEDLKKAKKEMSKEDFQKYEIDKKYEQINRQYSEFYNAIFNDEVVDYINSCE